MCGRARLSGLLSPRRSARRSCAAALSSSSFDGFTRIAGRSSAIAVWKRRSYSPSISSATSTSTAPVASWSRRALPGQPAREPPAPDHQDVQDHRGSEAVGERHREPPGGEGLRRRHGDHAGQDRPGARRVHESQARAEEETGPEALARARRAPGARRHEPAERGLEPGAQRRDQKREPEYEQHHDGDRPDQVVREPERVYYIDERDGRERERQREPGHHAERPAPPAGHAGRQRHRQHGEDARRHGGCCTGHEPEDDQQRHSGHAGRRVRLLRAPAAARLRRAPRPRPGRTASRRAA